MRDPIATAFSRFDVEPELTFVAELRRRAVAELTRESALIDTQSPPDPGDLVTIRSAPERERPSSRPRRRWLTLTAAAAVVLVLVAIPVLARQDRQNRVDAPGPGQGFSHHLSGDLTLPDGSSVRFEADVAVSQAVESDEIGVTGKSDIILLPRVRLSVSTSLTDVELSSAYAQIYLRSDIATCVVNTAGCDAAIVRGTTDSTHAPLEVTSDHPYELDDSRSISTIRVSSDSVASILSDVSSGTAVVGVAIVVSDASGRSASAIFDNAGRPVLGCSDVPLDCLDPGRIETSGSSGAASGDSDLQPFPPGDIPPGTYASEGPVVPYALTTVGAWQLLASSPSTAFLGRGTFQTTELVVIEDRIAGIDTAADAIAKYCPTGSVDFGPTTPTTLLGVRALRAEGPVLTECSTLLLPPLEGTEFRRLQAKVGSTLRIVAAEVDGTLIVVVAVAPTAEWTTFAAELDATSLRKL